MTIRKYITPLPEILIVDEIDEYLTAEPRVTADCTLRDAIDLMSSQLMDYLPVYEENELIGAIYHLHITKALLDIVECKNIVPMFSEN